MRFLCVTRLLNAVLFSVDHCVYKHSDAQPILERLVSGGRECDFMIRFMT